MLSNKHYQTMYLLTELMRKDFIKLYTFIVSFEQQDYFVIITKLIDYICLWNFFAFLHK